MILAIRKITGHGKDNLSFVINRYYGTKISATRIGNVLRRENLLKKSKHWERVRKLSDYVYYPGEIFWLDVKHWHRGAYQYDIIDCATRIKDKRPYVIYIPENAVSYDDGKIYINSEQYFGNVPSTAWNFYIGGYQPA